jgi:hypothetical protein
MYSRRPSAETAGAEPIPDAGAALEGTGRHKRGCAVRCMVSGPVALSLCATARPLYTRFANIFGASISETAVRPNPSMVSLL